MDLSEINQKSNGVFLELALFVTYNTFALVTIKRLGVICIT